MFSQATEIKKIQRTEKGYQESLKEKTLEVSNHIDDNDDRIPLTKDLTAVYEKIVKTKGVHSSNENLEVVLQKIPSSSVAVFQNMKNEESSDNMRTEVCLLFICEKQYSIKYGIMLLYSELFYIKLET